MTFPAGYRVLEGKDRETSRPVQVHLWYPAAPESRETLLIYPLGSRGFAALDAPSAESRSAVILFSPGGFSSVTSYSWMTEGLARRGFMVAGVARATEPESPTAAGPETGPARPPDRPRNCSAALDTVLAWPGFEHTADAARIGAIGHGAGGADVIALAGAVFDAGAMSRYCGSDAARADRTCSGWESPAPGRGEGGNPPQDERIRAVVLMDPACGPGHDARSLSRVTIPVHVIGSVDNDFLPFAHHAGRYARLIPGASLTPLAHGEGHFVFVDECSGNREIQGVPVCRDNNGVRRPTVHAQLMDKISRFFEEHLAPS